MSLTRILSGAIAIIALLLAVLLLIIPLRRHSVDVDGGMKVQLELDASTVMRKLTRVTDEKFELAMKGALKRRRSSKTDQSLPALFLESLNEVSAGNAPPLTKYFMNRDLSINFNSSNQDVIRTLEDRINAELQRSFTIIRARVDKFGVSDPEMQLDMKAGRIQLELPGIEATESLHVLDLLRTSANLEFWETVGFTDAYTTLARINTEVQKIEGVDTAHIYTGFPYDAEAHSEKFKRDNPFYAKLMLERPNMEVIPLVGHALISDTSALNHWMQLEQVKNVIPFHLKFLWEAKPEAEHKDRLGLVAIRTNREDKAPLDGSVITNAEAVGKGTSSSVELYMNMKGAKTWKKLTEQNLTSCIAIVVDGYVYSYPIVDEVIPNGRSMISGSFTSEETHLLASMLKAGALPSRSINVISMEIIEPVAGESLKKFLALGICAALAMVGFFIFVLAGRKKG